MEDDEDDFFAYQAAKSLNNKRTQLKQYFQAPALSKLSSNSSESNSESDDDLISSKKSKISSSVNIPKEIIVTERQQQQPTKSKDSIRNEIDAIVTSCFNKPNKEVKRKIKLGKRTAADDQEFEDEDEYISRLTQNHRRNNRRVNSLDKSQLEEEEEKVTRETAAYNRLEAILRVTKPLCEKQIDEFEEHDEDNQIHKQNDLNETDDELKSVSSDDNVTLKIDHADGRQLTLILPLKTTLNELYQQVSDRLCLSSISLVYHNQTLKLDQQTQGLTLKQLDFSSNEIQVLESYPIIKKIKIFIQTSNSSSNRRSSSLSKREYAMMDTDPFETIFEAYKRDMKSSNIRFEFDGDTLHPKATPSEYDMTDGEILDAFILTTNNK